MKISQTLKTMFILVIGIGFVITVQAQSSEKGPIKKLPWLKEERQGWYNVTTFSMDFQKGPFLNGMQTSAGFRFNPYIALGGGIGLERYVNLNTYETLSANFSMMPVFTELRYTMLDRTISPVVALQVGYKYMINEASSQVAYWREAGFASSYTDYHVYDYYHEGGMAFTVEGGVKMKVYNRLGLYLAVSYSSWNVSGEHYRWMMTHLEAPGGDPVETTSVNITPTTAYQQMWLLRIGFTL